MATERTDVVIVGVGAAGGILAAELSKAGMRVIGRDSGPVRPPLTELTEEDMGRLTDLVTIATDWAA